MIYDSIYLLILNNFKKLRYRIISWLAAAFYYENPFDIYCLSIDKQPPLEVSQVYEEVQRPLIED